MKNNFNFILIIIFYSIYILNIIYGCDIEKCDKIVESCILKKECICEETTTTTTTTATNENDPIINVNNNFGNNNNNIILTKKCKHSKICFNCMNDLFIDCCDCIGYCSSKYKNLNENEKLRRNLSKLSNVGDYKGHSNLFLALIKDPDDVNDDWTVEIFSAGKHMKNNSEHQKHLNNHECSVLFHKSCLSLNKCQRNCESFGAFGYRWFHNGCCECIGPNCINYGINQSLCRDCPAFDEYEENSANNENDRLNEIDDEL